MCGLVCLYGLLQFIGANFLGAEYLYLDLPSVAETHSVSGYTSILGGLSRATSIFREPRHFGMFMVLPLIITLWSLLPGQKFLKSRALSAFGVALFSLGIILSFSLSAYLSSIISIIIISFIDDKFKGNFILAASIAGIALLSVHAFFVMTGYFDVIGYIGQRLNVEYSDLKYIDDYNVTLFGVESYLRGSYITIKYALENPLTGVGLNQYEILSPVRRASSTPPLYLLSSIGFVGFLFFVFFVYSILRRLHKLVKLSGSTSKKQNMVVRLSLIMVIVVVVNSLFLSNYNYTTSWFWIGMMIPSSVYFNVKQHV
jgi:O-antigen ligase